MAISEAGTRDTVQAGNYRGKNRYASTYDFNQGILVLPLADPASGGRPVEIVRVHQPYRIRRIEFEANKTSTPPLVPAPQDNDNEYMLSASLSIPMPGVNGDRSTLNWGMIGRYDMIEKGAWTMASGLRIGDMPVADTPAALTALGSVLGGAGIVALTTQSDLGETLADSLGDFSSESYAAALYNYNLHFPSRYFVADLAEGN